MGRPDMFHHNRADMAGLPVMLATTPGVGDRGAAALEGAKRLLLG